MAQAEGLRGWRSEGLRGWGLVVLLIGLSAPQPQASVVPPADNCDAGFAPAPLDAQAFANPTHHQFVDLTASAGVTDVPHGVAISSEGSWAVVASVDDNFIYKFNFSDPWNVQKEVLVGSGTASCGLGDTTRLSAQVDGPVGLAFSPDGSILYWSDYACQGIKQLTFSTGTVAVVAGGLPGADDGVGASAKFSSPHGICIAPSGNELYVADTDNDAIRKVDLAGTFGDTTTLSFAGGATITKPVYCQVTNDGSTLFFTERVVAPSLKRLDLGTFQISELISSTSLNTGGASASDVTFDLSPTGEWLVLVDRAGNRVYLYDLPNNNVAEVTDSTLTTTTVSSVFGVAVGDGFALMANTDAASKTVSRLNFCSKCLAGFFAMDHPSVGGNNQPCAPCPQGQFSSAEASAECTSCPVGTYSEVSGATSNSSCSPCPLNTYCPAGSPIPAVCPGSSISPLSSSSLSDCICPPGFSGSPPCSVCPFGTYKNSSGTGACDSCTAGNTSTAREGAISANECTCAPGYQLSPDGHCRECPQGLYKAKAGAEPCAVCRGVLNSSINCIEGPDLPDGVEQTPLVVNCTLDQTWEELIKQAEEGQVEILSLDDVGFSDLYQINTFQYVVCVRDHSCLGSQRIESSRESVCFLYNEAKDKFVPWTLGSDLHILEESVPVTCEGYSKLTAAYGTIALDFPPSGPGSTSFCSVAIMPNWFYPKDAQSWEEEEISPTGQENDAEKDYGWSSILRGRTVAIAASSPRFTATPAWIQGLEPAKAENYPFLVSVQTKPSETAEEWEHGCSGVLVQPQWVLTTALCVEPCVGGCPQRVVLISGKGIVDYGVQQILVDPVVYQNGVEGMALLRLDKEVQNASLAVLMDAKAVDEQQCSSISAVAWNREIIHKDIKPTNWSGNISNVTEDMSQPAMWTTDVELVGEAECHDYYKENAIEEYVLPSQKLIKDSSILCARYLASESELCRGDLGALMVTHREGKLVVLGLASSGENCLRSGSTPALFSRFSLQANQWILSVLGVAPPSPIRLFIESLSIPPGGSLAVYRGTAQSPPDLLMMFDGDGISCPEERVELEVNSAGAFLLAFSARKNGTSEMNTQSRESHFRLIGRYESGFEPCQTTLSGICRLPGCKTQINKWDVLKLSSERHLSGALTKLPGPDYAKTWTCLRDWNVTEQAMCGLSVGEWGCFYWNEKDTKFEFQGTGTQLRMVLPE